MSFLRTISTTRLVALCASAVAIAAGGTAIALAGGSGPVPPPKPLAQAVHDAATAPKIQGITADVTFTNHLVDSSGIEGGNPLLKSATGRLWVSPGKGLRLELQSDNGDAQIVADKTGWWVYDGTSNTLYSGQFPAGAQGHEKPGADAQHQVPSVAKIQSEIAKLGQHLTVSGANPSDVGGQPAYTVRVGPKGSGGLLGAAELAWDAARGVPLRAALYARGNGNPVLELSLKNISYGTVSPSTYTISPPPNAKHVDVTGGAKGTTAGRKPTGHGKHAADKPAVTGAAAVARKLSFPLSAPASLAGLPRTNVRLLQLKDSAAALVTYGTGPGGIAVLERVAKPQTAAQPPSNGDHHHGGQVQLPTVTIGGATASVLDTPLGSVVTFQRAGVSYVVLGSVHAAVAEAAARGL
jgi:outer membrane lipoprotein-sorting protein